MDNRKGCQNKNLPVITILDQQDTTLKNYLTVPAKQSNLAIKLLPKLTAPAKGAESLLYKIFSVK